MGLLKSLAALVAAVAPIEAAYDWKNVRIGGGGGFIPSVVFHPNVSGLAYARTDIGGVYRMNSDQTWTPITDSIAFNASWHNWGCDALAVDPQNEDKVYAAVGMYTNDWDPNNGAIIRSADKGETWEFTNLTFKVGGNMPGRGMGERLAVDPANSDIIYFGARSGKGLWKSTDGGKTFANVTSFTDTGPFAPNPKDPNDYENDPQGLTFVTFDSTSATIDGATSRIFVGTADNSTSGASVWQTKDAGKTWTAVPNQPKKYFPHKCRLSPTEQAMYLSYSDGTGPYDGTMGGVHRYDLKNSSWTDITPVSGSNLYFGFGGLSVDIKNPGTVMVAALNSWWPDAQIFRSNDSGATWSQLWEWESYPTRSLYYGSNYTAAPWIGEFLADDTKKLGWMIESLEIDPHDSDHWVYGTGLTMFGGNDLTKWDTVHNITIDVMATGIEEMAVLGLASVPNGTELLAAVGDDSGFTFASSSDLGTSPNTMWGTPTFTSSTGVDYAGTTPKTIVRIGNSAGTPQVAMSNDGGVKWYKNYAAGTKAEGGSVALSADATSIVWSTANNGVMHSTNSASFSAVSSLPSAAVIASDKRSAKYFYAGSGSNFYVSSDGGATFAKSGASSLTGVGGIRAIAVHPSTGGNVYVSTDIGVFASKDFGKTFSALGKGVISNAYAISLGKGSTGTNIYVLADGSAGAKLYASADGGSTWADIQGDKQGFASLPSCVLAGSNNVADQVYVGTNGRGVMYASGSVSSGTAATTGSVVGSSAAAAATGTYSNSTTSAVTASASIADVASSTEAASTEAASTEAASAAASSSSTTAAASAAETSSSDDDSCSADSGDSTWASATTTAASATETGSDDDSCDSDDGDATSTASAAASSETGSDDDSCDSDDGDATSTASAAAASETGSDDDSCDSDDGDATSTASAAAASETGSDDDSCDSDDGDATSTASAAAASETGSDDDSCDSDDGDATSTTSTAAAATATGSDDDDSCSADDSSKTAVAVSAADVSTATSSAASSSATDSGSDSDDDDSCSSDDGDDDDSSSADASSATSTGEASAAATSAAATSAAATSAAATSAAATSAAATSAAATSAAATSAATSSSSAAAAATSSASSSGSSSSGSSSSGSSSGTAAEYGQCGGKNWKGATTCATGFTCKVMNPYYSQCV